MREAPLHHPPSTPPFVLAQDGERFLAFVQPSAVLYARDASGVTALLQQADAALAAGRFVAGYLAYEAAAAFGLETHDPDPDGPPLAWLGVFDPPSELRLPLPPLGPPPATAWTAGLDASRYGSIVRCLQERIAAGDTYQLNFTFPLTAPLAEEPFDVFVRLVSVQRPRYAAFVDLGRHVIVSASPELFFEREGERITTRPMKGTAARGATPEDDERSAEALRASEKDRAENIMIVDMLRNDLGRIAEVGSVVAGPTFEVERYPTLLQMTSTVRARSRVPLAELFAALFPCASVTGAPKVRTMALLKEHEAEPRGVYTGAIGWAGPDGRTRWNVAIRTALADRERRSLVFGVGSGIVADSRCEAEYAECLLKARILEEPAFALVETMAFLPDEGFRNLAGHLVRLRASAGCFRFRFDSHALEHSLRDLFLRLDQPSRVRLLLYPDGEVTSETAPLPPDPERPLRVGLARHAVDSASPWLCHKTTRRDVYERAQASRPDCDEVLLWNERGEVTETTIANVVFEAEGRRVTPPATSGLLPGVARARLLADGDVEEEVVPVASLRPGTPLRLVSALRGTREAVFVG